MKPDLADRYASLVFMQGWPSDARLAALVRPSAEAIFGGTEELLVRRDGKARPLIGERPLETVGFGDIVIASAAAAFYLGNGILRENYSIVLTGSSGLDLASLHRVHGAVAAVRVPWCETTMAGVLDHLFNGGALPAGARVAPAAPQRWQDYLTAPSPRAP